MSPSRGTAGAASSSTSSPSSSSLSSPTPSPSTETTADINSRSALSSLRTNFKYLLDPSSPTSPRPLHLRTRAALRTVRYLGIFIFWRIVRYAKYAIVGSIVAAVGATALGPVLGTAAFVVAPPTIVASIGVGMCWGLARWGWRRMGVTQAVEKGGVRETERAREGVSVDGGWRDVQGPRAVPW